MDLGTIGLSADVGRWPTVWVLVQKLLAISSQLVSSWEGIDKRFLCVGRTGEHQPLSELLTFSSCVAPGAACVVFSSHASYIAAVSARFMQLNYGSLDKKVHVACQTVSMCKSCLVVCLNDLQSLYGLDSLIILCTIILFVI